MNDMHQLNMIKLTKKNKNRKNFFLVFYSLWRM